MKKALAFILVLSLLCTTAMFGCGNEDLAERLTTEEGTTPTITPAPEEPPDTTAPVISSVASADITLNSAMITWDTNEAATGQVEYGTTTSYGSTTTLNTTLAIGHSVELTGIAPETTYHYRVKSKDGSDNEAISDDNTLTTTVAPEPEPSDPNAPSIRNQIEHWALSTSSVRIDWHTNEDSTQQVEYGIDTSYGMITPLGEPLHDFHKVTLTGLDAGVTYHFRVRSKDAAGNEVVSEDHTFTVMPYTLIENTNVGVPFASPSGIATDGQHFWLTYKDGDTHKLVYYNANIGEVIKSFDLPDLGQWVGGITWDGEAVWISVYDPHKIVKIDPDTGEILKTWAAFPTAPRIWPGTASICGCSTAILAK